MFSTNSYDAVRSAPYQGRSTNVGVAALNLLVFLAGCTAEAIALETASETALLLQQIFGVSSMLISIGTLFALTPLGSRLFSDTKEIRFPEPLSGDKAEHKDISKVAMDNPLIAEENDEENDDA